jgi:hypothetical protein
LFFLLKNQQNDGWNNRMKNDADSFRTLLRLNSVKNVQMSG